MSKTRAIRFSMNEEKLIQEFLNQNPIFDFSSLARTALLKFIQEPTLHLKAVKKPKKFVLERGL
jgi:hypothetical protein